LPIMLQTTNLDCVGKCVADVQGPSDIRWRDDDNKRGLVALNVGLEEAAGLPPVIPAAQEVGRRRRRRKGDLLACNTYNVR